MRFAYFWCMYVRVLLSPAGLLPPEGLTSLDADGFPLAVG
jgi:hypothetical protein